MNRPWVIVDDRERAGGLARELQKILGEAAVQARRLALGDVQVGQRFLVERKTVADFAASRADGRLTSQLSRLAASGAGGGPRGMVVFEGAFDDAARLGLDPEVLRAWILATMLAWRLPLVHAANPRETAQWIAALARQDEVESNASHAWFSPEKQHRATFIGAAGSRAGDSVGSGAGASVRSPQALQAGTLEQIPGMGRAKARALLKRFGSIHGIRAATPAEWLATPGVGPEVAKALECFFAR
jgi:ERCC4-type nuclease